MGWGHERFLGQRRQEDRIEIILEEQKDPSTRESNKSGDTQFARMRAGSSLVWLMATAVDLLSLCQGETAYE